MKNQDEHFQSRAIGPDKVRLYFLCILPLCVLAVKYLYSNINTDQVDVIVKTFISEELSILLRTYIRC